MSKIARAIIFFNNNSEKEKKNDSVFMNIIPICSSSLTTLQVHEHLRTEH